MRLLVDTHALLWFFSGHSNLSDTVRDLMEDTKHQKLISLATVWEMAIKQSKKKLDLGKSSADYIGEKIQYKDFELLPIDLKHLTLISTLPFHHSDPFDRLLICQCIIENIPILSKDIAFDAYPIERIWH